jgi:hypothetical protein
MQIQPGFQNWPVAECLPGERLAINTNGALMAARDVNASRAQSRTMESQLSE